MPLPEFMNNALPRLPINRFYVAKKHSVLKSNTISQCTAFVTRQINRQTYYFISLHTLTYLVFPSFNKKGPAKSQPVLKNEAV